MPASTTSAAAEDTICSSSLNDVQKPLNDAKPGVWIGIDLGTSFSSAAVWSIDDGRAKLLRLGGPSCHNLASPPKYKDGNYKKAGKIVPSAVLFLSGVDAEVEGNNKNSSNSSNKRKSAGEKRLAAATANMPEAIRDALEDVQSCEGIVDALPTKDENDTSKISALLGYAASSAVDRSFQHSLETNNTDGKNSDSTSCDHHEQLSRAYATSVKRVLGVTTAQVKKELVEDEEFVKSLPFSIEIVKEKQQSDGDDQDTFKAKSGHKNADEDIYEGVLIRISPLSCQSGGDKEKSSTELKLRPMQVVALLLRSIRLEAQRSLQKHKLNAPGSEDQQTNIVRNCVVGVPAHFGRVQREAVKQACRLAGFDGHVATLTESSAAAIAYGIFVAAKPVSTGDRQDETDGEQTESRNKTILVFDMGGGTTDVTICEMMSDASRRFKVVATAGDRRLGGDDVDEALVQYVRTRILSDVDATLSQNEHQLLRQKCRAAKEKLCGNGDDPPPAPEVIVEHNDTKIIISQDKFDGIIQPFVSRAGAIVEEALGAYATHLEVRRARVKVDEVVLVGGSSRVPAVRTMLKNKFSEIPELCYSIKPEAAVSQGAAVQAAILSGCVPMHELRSAMM